MTLSTRRAVRSVQYRRMTPDEVDALLAHPSLLDAAMAVAPGEELAVATRLRSAYDADLVAAAFSQAELRRAARAKFERADRMLFTRDGLEQASAEVVARHRAARLDGLGPALRVADLCCGIGGDLVALADGRQVLAVDRDPLHARLARHNAGVYDVGGAVTVMCADVRDVALERGALDWRAFDSGALDSGALDVDVVFVDPARRAGGGRLGAIATDPPLEWALSLAATVPTVVKAAPGVPHTVVPDGWEAEFVSVAGELKEACLWSPQLAAVGTRATLLPGGHTLVPLAGDPLPVAEPGEWLLDPDPAVTRAGLVQELGRELGAWQIDARIAFLSADEPLRSPFGRSHRVLESLPFRMKDLAAAVRSHGIGSLDVRRRGLAGDVDDIRRRLPLAGRARGTLMLTRCRERPWAMLCVDDDRPSREGGFG